MSPHEKEAIVQKLWKVTEVVGTQRISGKMYLKCVMDDEQKKEYLRLVPLEWLQSKEMEPLVRETRYRIDINYGIAQCRGRGRSSKTVDVVKILRI